MPPLFPSFFATIFTAASEALAALPRLYLGDNAATILGEVAGTNNFSTTDAPDTIKTVLTPVDIGTFAMEFSESVSNVNWFMIQDLESDFSLASNTIYKLVVHARHIGVDGDVGVYLSSSTTLASNQPRTELGILTSSDTSYANLSYMYNLVGTFPLVKFGFKENSGGNDGGVYIDSISLTQPTVSAGVELNTDANATSPTNETNATTGWASLNGPDTFASVSSPVDSEGGAFSIEVRS